MAVEKASFDLDLNTGSFDRKMARARASLDMAGQKFNAAGQSVGAAATAVSGFNTALGGATSKTNDLIGAAGNLATTFAAGGILSVGIAALTTGVGLLANRWAEQKKAQEDAASAAKAFAREIETSLRAQTSEAQKELERLTDELVNFGKTGPQVTLARAQTDQEFAQKTANALLEDEKKQKAEILATEQKLDELRRSARRTATRALEEEDAQRELALQKERLLVIEGQRQAAQDLLTTSNLQVGAAQALLAKNEKLRQELDKQRGKRGGGRSRRPRAGASSSVASSDGRTQVGPAEFEELIGMDMFEGPQAPAQLLIDRENEALQEQADMRQRLLDQADSGREELHQAEMSRIEAERLAREQQAAEYAAVTMQLTAMAFSAAEQIGLMIIRQEENIGAAVANLIAQQVGGFIQGEGIKLVGMGVTTAFSGNLPLAALQVGAGLAVASIGTGIKVGGAAALESAGGQLGGLAGAGASASAGGATSSGGAAPSRGSAAGGDSGAVNITINYGVGGPNPEEAQRAVAEAVRGAQRRGML